MSLAEGKDSTAPPPVSHASRVTQQGYTQIPNAIMLRGELSPVARLTYGYLKHLAWRGGGEECDPPREVIARDLGLNEKTVTAAMRELQKAPVYAGGSGVPVLVEAKRRGQGRTNLYVIHDPVEAPSDGPESGPSRKPESTSLEPKDLAFPARARQGSTTKTEVKGEPPPSPSADDGALENPPKLVQVEGRNLAVDALCSALGIDDKSPQVRQAVAAVNDTKGVPGIRSLYWVECRRIAEAQGDAGLDLLHRFHESGEQFERTLANRVTEKIRLIRERQPWRTFISPQNVRDLWLDVEATGATTGGFTADQLRNLRP